MVFLRPARMVDVAPNRSCESSRFFFTRPESWRTPPPIPRLPNTNTLPNSYRLRDVVPISIAIRLHHDRISHAKLRGCRPRPGLRADGQIVERVNADDASLVLRIAQDEYRTVCQRLRHRS